jgi:hypothetical protein
VSPEVELPTRTQAVRMLTEQRARIDELLQRLAPRDRTRPGLGGGEWSPKDLVSHLELWERFALDSVAAWARGERAPIDRELWSRSTSAINAEGVDAAAHLSWARATYRARATHAELLALIDSMPDAQWRTPATPRARKPLGMRIGQLLAGSTGPFSHDLAHVKDLRAFVDPSG